MPPKNEELERFGRFAEPAVLILISLAESPKHGYAITDDIERITGHRPGPGTLYGAIARLENRSISPGKTQSEAPSGCWERPSR